MNPWLGLVAGLLITAAMTLGFWLGLRMMRQAGWRIDGRAPTRDKILRTILVLAAVWTGCWIAGMRLDTPLSWCVPLLASGAVLVLVFRGFGRA